MSIEVRVAEGNELKKWNDIVGSSPHGTIFHTLEWLKIVEKHTNSKLYPLIGLKESTIIGVFPLFYQKKFLIKSVFSPPPKVSVPYLGPIFVDYVNLKQSKKESLYMEFQRKVDEFMVSQIKPNYISISLPVGLLDSRPFLWSGYRVEPMYNYIIDLSNGVDHVWGQFKRNLRANIQGAEKKGAYVEEGSKRGLNHLYNFLVERYDEQGRIFPISKRYLLDICNSFHPQNLEIFVVKYDGEFVGGLIDLYYKNKAISWIGLPKSDLKGIYVNDLLQTSITPL